MKTIKKNKARLVILGVLLGLSTSALGVANWQGTEWIKQNEYIDPVKIKGNFDYLYEKVENFNTVLGNLSSGTSSGSSNGNTGGTDPNTNSGDSGNIIEGILNRITGNDQKIANIEAVLANMGQQVPNTNSNGGTTNTGGTSNSGGTTNTNFTIPSVLTGITSIGVNLGNGIQPSVPLEVNGDIKFSGLRTRSGNLTCGDNQVLVGFNENGLVCRELKTNTFNGNPTTVPSNNSGNNNSNNSGDNNNNNNNSYQPQHNSTNISLNCDDKSTANEELYKKIGNRCGESEGLSFWNQKINEVGLADAQREFEATYINYCKEHFNTINIQTCNDNMLCDYNGGWRYLPNSVSCKK